MSRIFWKRVISGKQLAEGYQIPWGWGISYVKWDSGFTIIHPIPLNYIIAAARWLLWKVSVPYFVNLEKERIIGNSFENYNRGWDAGWEAKERQMQDEWDAGWREHSERVLARARKDKEERERGT